MILSSWASHNSHVIIKQYAVSFFLIPARLFLRRQKILNQFPSS